MNKARVRALLDQIYEAVAQLEKLFPGRKFTPDGIMVGSIGEVLAKQKYRIDLLPPGAKGHDARSARVGMVQIKTTQGNQCVAVNQRCNYLIVQRLLRDKAEVEEVYNGPGALAWALRSTCKSKHNNVGLGRLREAQGKVRVKVPKRRP